MSSKMQNVVRVRGDCSANLPKRIPPCGDAGIELVEGRSSDGVVIGLGASVGNGIEKGEVKSASSKAPRNMDEME